MLFDYEFVYVVAGSETREFTVNVPPLLECLGKLMWNRQVAGAMMLGVGVWYLGFGTRWIAWYCGGEGGTESTKSRQHLITGVQVCLFARRC